MPNPYLYAVIALVVALVVVGAYLGMMVSNEAAKAAALQGRLSALKVQYTQLQSQYNQLKVNYTDLISTISFYKDIVKPILYIAVTPQANFTMLLLNVTNPTNQYLNISLYVYTGPPSYFEVMWLPNNIEIPPNETFLAPVLLALFNGTAMATPTAQIQSYIYLSDFTTNNYLITVYTSRLTSLGLIGIMSNQSLSIVKVNKPFGYATFSPNSTFINIYIANPLSTRILIYGYDVFAYNGALLASCKIYNTLTNSVMPIPINATSIMNAFLPVLSIKPPSTYTGPLNGCSIYDSSLITCSVNKEFITLSAICMPYYVFPSSSSQMPYGYVILHTNIGDITIPLVSSSSWSWW